MGSNGPHHLPPPPPPPLPTSSADPEDEITVLVTGFAPFKSQYPINPSWSIVSTLPPFIHASSNTPHSGPSRRIRLLTHPSPIRVSYSTVRALVPTLWRRPTSSASPSAPQPQVDFLIHIGMAGGRDFYSVERRAHRDGYLMPDVDGVVLCDDRTWAWEGCPAVLQTDCDVDDVWRRWRAALPGVDVRTSEDAGRYLCDFIYYASLAELWKRGEERRVVFLHVPVDSDEAAVARGGEVLIELVRALVQSREMSRVALRQNESQKLVA